MKQEKVDTNTEVDQGAQEILAQAMLDSHIRGLRMQLRQLSKKQLVAMVVNLAVQIYKMETKK